MGEKDLTVFPFWEYLNENQKEDMKKQVRIVEYKKDQLIMSNEIDCLGVLYILEGLVRIYLYSEDGREVTISRLKSDEMCMLSASCMMSQINFPASMSAETDVKALLIPSVLMNRLKEENVYVENCVYKNTTERFSDIISAVEQMMFMTLEQRIITFLIDETAETGSDTVAMTQEKIAMAIGSAREAVSRILKQLSKDGFIEVSRGKIKIINKKGLYNKF